MQDTGTGGEQGKGDGAEGLSFGMLSRLISEGRTGEVPMKQIPEGTNVRRLSLRQGRVKAELAGSTA
jgi:hypothetical protein